MRHDCKHALVIALVVLAAVAVALLASWSENPGERSSYQPLHPPNPNPHTTMAQGVIKHPVTGEAVRAEIIRENEKNGRVYVMRPGGAAYWAAKEDVLSTDAEAYFAEQRAKAKATEAAPAADDGPAPTSDDGPAPTADDGPAPTADDGPAPTSDDGPAEEPSFTVMDESEATPPKKRGRKSS